MTVMPKTRKTACGAAAIFIVLALFVSSAHAKVLYGIAFGGNRNYEGGDYTHFPVKDLDECIKRCAGDVRCKTFAYADTTKACVLKEVIGKEVRLPGITAGQKL